MAAEYGDLSIPSLGRWLPLPTSLNANQPPSSFFPQPPQPVDQATMALNGYERISIPLNATNQMVDTALARVIELFAHGGQINWSGYHAVPGPLHTRIPPNEGGLFALNTASSETVADAKADLAASGLGHPMQRRWWEAGLFDRAEQQRARGHAYLSWWIKRFGRGHDIYVFNNQPRQAVHQPAAPFDLSHPRAVYVVDQAGALVGLSPGVLGHDKGGTADGRWWMDLSGSEHGMRLQTQRGLIYVYKDVSYIKLTKDRLAGVDTDIARRNDGHVDVRAIMAYYPEERQLGRAMRVEFYTKRTQSITEMNPVLLADLDDASRAAAQAAARHLGGLRGWVPLANIHRAFVNQPPKRTFAEYMAAINPTHIPPLRNAQGIIIEEEHPTSTYHFFTQFLAPVQYPTPEGGLVDGTPEEFKGARILVPPEVFAQWPRHQCVLYLQKLRNVWANPTNRVCFGLVGLDESIRTWVDRSAVAKSQRELTRTPEILRPLADSQHPMSFQITSAYYAFVASCMVASRFYVMMRDNENNQPTPEVRAYFLYDRQIRRFWRACRPDNNNHFARVADEPAPSVYTPHRLRDRPNQPKVGGLSEYFYPRPGTTLADVQQYAQADYMFAEPSVAQQALVRAQYMLVDEFRADGRYAAGWRLAFSDECVNRAWRAIVAFMVEPDNHLVDQIAQVGFHALRVCAGLEQAPEEPEVEEAPPPAQVAPVEPEVEEAPPPAQVAPVEDDGPNLEPINWDPDQIDWDALEQLVDVEALAHVPVFQVDPTHEQADVPAEPVNPPPPVAVEDDTTVSPVANRPFLTTSGDLVNLDPDDVDDDNLFGFGGFNANENENYLFGFDGINNGAASSSSSTARPPAQTLPPARTALPAPTDIPISAGGSKRTTTQQSATDEGDLTVQQDPSKRQRFTRLRIESMLRKRYPRRPRWSKLVAAHIFEALPKHLKEHA